MAGFALSSEAFRHGGEIPRRHTGDGDDLLVASRAGRRELDSALSGHVLATAELMGTDER